MEYQKIENFIDVASNQPTKFRTKNWVEINDESRRNTMLRVRSNLKLQW